MHVNVTITDPERDALTAFAVRVDAALTVAARGRDALEDAQTAAGMSVDPTCDLAVAITDELEATVTQARDDLNAVLLRLAQPADECQADECKGDAEPPAMDRGAWERDRKRREAERFEAAMALQHGWRARQASNGEGWGV